MKIHILKIFGGVAAILALLVGIVYFRNIKQNDFREFFSDKGEIIRIENPGPEQEVSSPLVIKGEARGNWFFEASFPITLTDWDGRIIAEHYAEAREDWMTENFVPFEASLEFESPYKQGDQDFVSRGFLILRKDNPSGLPEHDDALEIPVRFTKTDQARLSVLDFNIADYEAALASDKLIVLYFYADWCPICKEEFPKMQSVFQKLEHENVIGFRVNYNDDETNEAEKNLAREFGVGYQHTKVFVQNKKRVLKSPESWDEATYVENINSFLNP